MLHKRLCSIKINVFLSHRNCRMAPELMRNKTILFLLFTTTDLETPYVQTGHWFFVIEASHFQRVEAASTGDKQNKLIFFTECNNA